MKREPYRVLSLFAGIGGFDLGLEQTGGFKTVAVAETDPYASKVLAKHFPDAPNVGDVTTAEYPDADIICAGFPCQDISFAGLGAGLAGARSGLWREVVRAIRVVRPKYTLLENLAALLGRGLGDVLGDLAEVGYDAEWHCIPATAVGAPHRRDRIWIVAHAVRERGRGGDAKREDAKNAWQPSGHSWNNASGVGHWNTEPNVGRVAHGIPKRVDRLRCLGNAVVPQIPELIGRAILQSESAAA